mgnify:CR=1 FL=1
MSESDIMTIMTTVSEDWYKWFVALLSPAGFKVYVDWKKDRDSSKEAARQVTAAREHEKEMASVVAKLSEEAESRMLSHEAEFDCQLESFKFSNNIALQRLQAASQAELDRTSELNRLEREKALGVFNQTLTASVRAVKKAWQSTYLAYTETRHLYKVIDLDESLDNRNRARRENVSKWNEIRNTAERKISDQEK